MKIFVAICGWLVMVSCVRAETSLGTWNWEQAPEGGVIEDGVLKLENPTPEPRTFPLLVIEDPGVSEHVRAYAIRGEVMTEGVEGQGYLELWNHFPDGNRYFTRTTANIGMLKNLGGSQAWRAFGLPFHKEGNPAPVKLELNLVLPGAGTVYLKPVELVSLERGVYSLKSSEAWWSIRTTGVLNGITGILGGFFGIAIGLTANNRKRYGFALTMSCVMTAVGVVTFIATASATMLGQPKDVIHPLLIPGLVFTGVGILMIFVMKKRIRAAGGTDL